MMLAACCFRKNLWRPRLLVFSANLPSMAARQTKISFSRLGAVHVGTGGASPQIFDMQLGRYRDSCLADLYDAARLVDRLTHIHFFSRPLVARDMPDQQRLDLNTAYASLAGTTKHVLVSAGNAQSVADIARLCYRLAGSEAAFRERPFSLVIGQSRRPADAL